MRDRDDTVSGHCIPPGAAGLVKVGHVQADDVLCAAFERGATLSSGKTDQARAAARGDGLGDQADVGGRVVGHVGKLARGWGCREGSGELGIGRETAEIRGVKLLAG